MANVKKTIVCLANSKKLGERCIAGREWDEGKPGRWIRPVSSRCGGAISYSEMRYDDGNSPQLFDVIDVPLIKAKPSGCQTENWLLDPNARWKKINRIGWSDLPKLVDPVEDLWINSIPSKKGCNDRVEISEAGKLENSLRVLKLQEMRISVFNYYGRKVQARFKFNGNIYWLSVTDPMYEQRFGQKEDGEYPIGECYLTISLGEPLRGFCYKLVAAIFEPN